MNSRKWEWDRSVEKIVSLSGMGEDLYMDAKQSRKFVLRLYITQIAIFIVTGTINILAVNEIVPINLAKVISAFVLLSMIIITRLIEQHEDSKKTRSIFITTSFICVFWTITYAIVVFLH